MKLMLILKCILGLHIQIIEFTNAFDWADIPGGEPVLVELPRYYNGYGEQCFVVLRLYKILYGQAKSVRSGMKGF